MSESEEYIEYTENYGKIEPDLTIIPGSHRSINQMMAIEIRENINSCITISNKDKILKKLEELYADNKYMILELEYSCNCIWSNYTPGNTYPINYYKLYVDNFGNYYQYGIQFYHSSSHHYTNMLGFETSTNNLYKLSNTLIDFIKVLKIEDTIKSNGGYQTSFASDGPIAIHNIIHIVRGIHKLSEDNHKKNNYHEKLSVLIKENAELKAKLDEQTKLNEDICKRMFELKEKQIEKTSIKID